MRIRVVCVGRRARDPLLEAADDYLARLTRYVDIELVRLKESGLNDEKSAIAGRLKPNDRLIVLDERGEQVTTTDLAHRLARWRELDRDLVLLVGGADGIHPELKARAAETLALSRLTLPHRLAQVLLLEQLYRAYTVLRGEPYHRA
jgi:23S rRNA (pseudouridine1915-N3)-methyltransferase